MPVANPKEWMGACRLDGRVSSEVFMGYGDFTWRLREFLRKLLLFSMLGAVVYGGYHLYREGVFRRGIGPAVSSILNKIPRFGSRFQQHSHYSSRKHYSKPALAYKKKAHKKSYRGRAHHQRRHHRRYHR
ncbi:MAG: hypothetical protein HY537_05230 [Deltaproteobacteria bacterium]|nr:hypothetical protein [Deltaproteobacteria bacterium]